MMKFISDFTHLFMGSRPIETAHVLEPVADRLNSGTVTPQKEDMRRATRLALSVPVRYRVKDSGLSWQLTTSQDYSSLGIRLILLSPLRPGTEIEMKISLPEIDHPVHLFGEIVWMAQTSHRHANHRVLECGVSFNLHKQEDSHKDKLIYIIANKFCRLGLNATRQMKTNPVATEDELRECFRIIYRGYHRRGYCLTHPTQMYYHHYIFVPGSRTFALKDKNKTVGTISLIADSSCGLPLEKLFSRELGRLRSDGRKLAEVSMLALEDNKSRPGIFSLANFEKQIQLFRLFKIMYEYARNVTGVTDLVIGVHPKHETLYRYLKFIPLGAPKRYQEARGNPALPMHLDIVNAEVNYPAALKEFFLRDKTSVEQLKSGLKIDGQIVRNFLCHEQQLWPGLSPQAQVYFRTIFEDIFDAI